MRYKNKTIKKLIAELKDIGAYEQASASVIAFESRLISPATFGRHLGNLVYVYYNGKADLERDSQLRTIINNIGG